MTTKPAIGMLLSRFYPCQGGAEIQCLRLSRELKKRGYAVTIITQRLRDLPSREEIDGLPVRRLGIPREGKTGSLSYFICGLIWLLRRRKETMILHAHLASAPALLSAAARLWGVPSLLKFGGSRSTGDIATSRRTWYGRIKLALLRRFITCFVCPSQEILQELLQAGFAPGTVSVIPNGVDTARYAPVPSANKMELRRTLGLDGGSTTFVYAGRFARGKGLEVLLKAWSEMNAAGQTVEARLIMLGDGPLLEPLKSEYAALPRTEFRGWTDDTLPYFQAGDVFVLPSLGEGMPNSLAEAMSCAMGCIGTDIGGIRELITHRRTGLLVEPGSVVSLREGMQCIAASKPMRDELGAGARISIEQKYSLERVTDNYSALYSRMSGGN